MRSQARPPLSQASARVLDRSRIQASVILPTYNEAENIADVVASVQNALFATPRYEILVVDDDSPDETWRVVDALARQDERIRCYRRIGRRGLARAIVDGLEMARGERLVVMDADLQHSPSVLPELLAALQEAELAIASRYAPGGSTGTWAPSRLWASRLGAIVGRWVLGLSTTDPLSGFFAVRRQTFQRISHLLRPRGFKALIEILFQARDARIAEVPYRFEERRRGSSKLSRSVVLDYLWSLIELRTRRCLSSRCVRYCLVGFSGVLVQLTVLAASLAILVNGLALALAILAATISNFTLNNLWTFHDRRLAGSALGGGLIRFLVISAVGAFLNHHVSMRFHQMTHLDLIWSSLTGIVVATAWNYELNRLVTWRSAAGNRTDS